MMVAVVSSNPTRGNIIFCQNFFKTLDVNFVQKCQICVENKNKTDEILRRQEGTIEKE